MTERRRFSLAGRLAFLISVNVAFTVLLTLAAARVLAHFGIGGAIAAAVALLIAIPTGLMVSRGFAERITRSMTALIDGVRGFRDEDFSLRLAVRGHDEISDLVRLYNEMGEVLRTQRGEIYQKELLLDTILQRTPIAIVLTNPADRVVYANDAAREMIGSGTRLDGRRFAEVVTQLPEPMRQALSDGRDALLTIPVSGQDETFHLTQRIFHLNTQRHMLFILERLTPELRRQELSVWKRAIRTMNHELNNSLAPVSSLIHSIRHVQDNPEHSHHLDEIYAAIDERLLHLREFLEGYAEFARLPAPRREQVAWSEVFSEVARLYPFRLAGSPPPDGSFDRSQMQQVLINLLKNAYESGSAAEDVVVEIARGPGGTQIRVLDHGRGMTETTMRQAILPFYSTKPSGTGLGLALCNEIIDAHGGRLSLQAREGGGTAATIWLPE